jgi:hypothetical protein
METAKKHFGYVSIRWICGYIYAVTLGKKRTKRYQKVNFIKKTFIQLYFIFRLFVKRWAWIYFWKYTINSISNFIGIYGEPYQGALYDDGWVSRFCIISFEKEKDAHTLFLEGRHAGPDKDSLKIDVIINGEKVNVIYIKQKGKFKFTIKVPHKHRTDDLLMVMLKPRKTFAPRNHGMNDDRRRLSFILEKIELR